MVEGDDVLKQIEEVGSDNGTPRAIVVIKNCGEVKEEAPKDDTKDAAK